MMVGTDYKSFPMFMSLKCLVEVRAVSLKPNTCCAKKHFDRKVMLYLIERDLLLEVNIPCNMYIFHEHNFYGALSSSLFGPGQ